MRGRRAGSRERIRRQYNGLSADMMLCHRFGSAFQGTTERMKSSAYESFDHCLHHRRSNAVAEHFDAIATAAVIELVHRRKAHCAPKFIYPPHSKHRFTAIPRDETEPIK